LILHKFGIALHAYKTKDYSAENNQHETIILDSYMTVTGAWSSG